MRADAKVLLERLGRSDFRYREFVDRFADLESWPIFEALLKDPRIIPQTDAAAIEAVLTGEGERQPAARPHVVPPHVVPPHVAPSHAAAPRSAAHQAPVSPEVDFARQHQAPPPRPVPVAPIPAAVVAPVAPPVAVAQPTAPVTPAPAPVSSLFGRYGRPERAQNIRTLLERLSDAVEGGDA